MNRGIISISLLCSFKVFYVDILSVRSEDAVMAQANKGVTVTRHLWVRSPLKAINYYSLIFWFLHSGQGRGNKPSIEYLHSTSNISKKSTETGCLNTRFPPPTRYIVKLIYLIWFIHYKIICVLSTFSGSIYRRGARRWRKLYRVNGHIFQAKRFNRVSIWDIIFCCVCVFLNVFKIKKHFCCLLKMFKIYIFYFKHEVRGVVTQLL